MKLLFIENRYKTFFFDVIASQLSQKGYEIHFIIQNKEFLPKGNFTNHIIKYPSSINYTFNTDPEVEGVIKSDRQLNHFNKKDVSYFYYYNDRISEIIDRVNPNLVFGESTAFHELLTINNCRQRNILYLNPSTCRYPVGRFSFYKYDTLEPFKGSEELLKNKEAQKIIEQIVYRKSMPDYMKSVPISKNQKVKDQFKKVYAYINGERFNTPNPIVKYKIEKQKEMNITKWDAFAKDSIDKESNKFKILYPLQMQPEANIDVWGKKYRNQSELIKTIAKNIPKDTVLYVKPNPKSKYELSKDLFNVLSNSSNIIALKHATKMDEVLPFIDLVITVTGTIAIECVLSNKPVINLVRTINHKAKNCTYIETVKENLINEIDKVKQNIFPKLNEQEKINFINVLNSTSYKGVISDPYSDANCLNEENIKALEEAFMDVFKN